MSNNDFGNVPNPYQSSVPPPVVVSGTLKPVTLTVFGVINIVWGLMVLFGVIYTTAQLAFASAQPQAIDPTIQVMRASSLYFGFVVTSLGMGVIAMIALIVGGIGLLNDQAYGRTLSIAYSVYGIIFSLLGMVFNLTYMFEPTMEQLKNIPEGPEKMGARVGVVGFMVGMGICGLIYPIVLLAFMMRAPVVNYLRGQQQHRA